MRGQRAGSPYRRCASVREGAGCPGQPRRGWFVLAAWARHAVSCGSRVCASTAFKAAEICSLGLHHIIAAMRAHGELSGRRGPSEQAVQENAAGVLWSLAFSSGECQAAPLLTARLPRRSRNILIRRRAHNAADENKDAVWRAGGIDRLLECMKAYPNAVVLQENCCGAIWNLCTKGELAQCGRALPRPFRKLTPLWYSLVADPQLSISLFWAPRVPLS